MDKIIDLYKDIMVKIMFHEYILQIFYHNYIKT